MALPLPLPLEHEESDYGSEIASDEEVSLTELLQQVPLSPPLVVKDIEDNEGPRTARLPRAVDYQRRERKECSLTTTLLPVENGTKKNAVEIESYRSVSAPGRFQGMSHGCAD